MKFTLRRNGQLMATLRVQHYVGREELVSAIAYRASREGLDEVPDNPSRSWIAETARDVLKRTGNETADYWRDDAEDDADEVEAWAEAAVNGAFPELARQA